mmetsp:Transcript_120421/g.348046  ORF Transcript_120421/g.348046 Transcript_120421/m.348046 type:complete len:229 (+) Transcript_120421:418-1104(+)
MEALPQYLALDDHVGEFQVLGEHGALVARRPGPADRARLGPGALASGDLRTRWRRGLRRVDARELPGPAAKARDGSRGAAPWPRAVARFPRAGGAWPRAPRLADRGAQHLRRRGLGLRRVLRGGGRRPKAPTHLGFPTRRPPPYELRTQPLRGGLSRGLLRREAGALSVEVAQAAHELRDHALQLGEGRGDGRLLLLQLHSADALLALPTALLCQAVPVHHDLRKLRL